MDLKVLLTTGSVDYIFDPDKSIWSSESMYLFMNLDGMRVAVPDSVTDQFETEGKWVMVGLLDLNYKQLVEAGVQVRSDK